MYMTDDGNYEVLEEALKDEEYRKLCDRMVVLWWEAEQRCEAAGGDGTSAQGSSESCQTTRQWQ